jgi:hypothetical protein
MSTGRNDINDINDETVSGERLMSFTSFMSLLHNSQNEPRYRRWRIRRASGNEFGVFVPKGATIAEMTAFFCGCTCIPER